MITVFRPLLGVTGASADQAQMIGVEGHWGRDPRAAMPVAPDVANPLLPIAGYGYDPMLNLWVPNVSSGGYVIEKFSELIANLMASQLAQTADLTDDADAQVNQLGSLLELINGRLGGNQPAYLWQSLLGSMAALGFRKTLGTDGGAYVAPAAGGNQITFTGVDLDGLTPLVAWNVTERRLHLITAIADPVPPAAGTITLATPVGVANTVWLIPYLSVPHAYTTATDSLRVTNIAPEWSHYAEPTVFINQASQPANNTYQFGPIPCLDYSKVYLQIDWAVSAPGTRVCSWRIYGKMDNAAWPAAGTINDAQDISSWQECTPDSIPWRSPPIATGRLVCKIITDHQFDSFMVEAVMSNGSAHNTTILGYYGLSGRGR